MPPSNQGFTSMRTCPTAALSARMGNFDRDKPLKFVWFVALGLLLSIASHIATQRPQWQIPLLTEHCLTQPARFILNG